MTVYLVRHGKTPGNARHAYVGRTDEALLPAGEALAAECSLPPVERLYASPMRRCLQTAALLYPGSVPVLSKGLRETDFGRFEGKTYDELKDDPAYRDWVDAGGTPPGGESREDFCRRSREAFAKALDDCFCAQVRTAAFVIHGGTIMAILSAFARPARDFYAWQVPNLGGWEWKAERALWENEHILTSPRELRAEKSLEQGEK